MMIKAAGGLGWISPLEFNERRGPRFSRSAWIAVGVVTAAHLAVGGALLSQRFEMGDVISDPLPPTTTVTFYKPPPKTTVEQRDTPPPPPTTRTNTLPAPPTTTDTVVVASGETVVEGPTLTFDDPPPIAEAGAAPTEIRPPTPLLITRPSWARQPTGEQLARAYPMRALEAGVSGSVTLNCLVEVSRRVSDCRVASEAPAGQGFSRAAQSLTRYFQISPRTVNGAAEGSRVNITLRFDPPKD